MIAPLVLACLVEMRDAVVVTQAPAVYPESARGLELGPVDVTVRVTVDSSGKLVAAKIVKSSSNLAIDQAALRATRNSTYAPTIVDCVPVQDAVDVTIRVAP